MVSRIEATDAFFAGTRELGADGGLVEERLRLILEVRPGERPLLPSFGCRVHGMEAIETQHDEQLAAVFIEETLGEWAPWAGVRRVKILAVDGAQIQVRLEGRAPVMDISFSLQGEENNVC